MAPEDVLQNRRIAELHALRSPADLRAELPVPAKAVPKIAADRRRVEAALDGTDDRLVVVVGPCSIHDPEAGIDYAQRLAAVAERLSPALCVVMRAYFEKPRTALGWKGLVNDPGLDGSFRVEDGLRIARKFLLDVSALGLPVGCEFLDPIVPQYLADVVSWGAIGARTAQSQIHRQLASGLSMAVGIKNPTDGGVQGAVDAITAARASQVFPGIDEAGQAAIVRTTGNEDAHLVLRGTSSGPNHDAASVADALGVLEKAGLPRRVVIDASHGNSGKDYQVQAKVAAELAERVATGEREIVGVMLESFLVAGRQDLDQSHPEVLVRGQSITDACMGWETTESVLDDLAAAVLRRRELVGTAG